MLLNDVSLDSIFDYLKEIKRVFITVWMCVFFTHILPVLLTDNLLVAIHM